MKTQVITQKCPSVGFATLTQKFTGRIKITIRDKNAIKNTSPIIRGLMTIVNRFFHIRNRCYYALITIRHGDEYIKGDAVIYSSSVFEARDELLETLESNYPYADWINCNVLAVGITQAREMRERYWLEAKKQSKA